MHFIFYFILTRSGKKSLLHSSRSVEEKRIKIIINFAHGTIALYQLNHPLLTGLLFAVHRHRMSFCVTFQFSTSHTPSLEAHIERARLQYLFICHLTLVGGGSSSPPTTPGTTLGSREQRISEELIKVPDTSNDRPSIGLDDVEKIEYGDSG